MVLTLLQSIFFPQNFTYLMEFLFFFYYQMLIWYIYIYIYIFEYLHLLPNLLRSPGYHGPQSSFLREKNAIYIDLISPLTIKMFIFVEKKLVTKYKPGHGLFLQKITFY